MNDALLAFLATVTGSVTTLFGVVLTLRWSQTQHQKSVEVEQKRRKEEREYVARRDSLVTANEAVTRFIQFLLTLPDRELPANGELPSEVRDLGISINRLHYFCTLDTLSKMMELGKIMNESVGAAVKAKMPASFLHHDILSVDSEAANLGEINYALKEEIAALLQSSPRDPLIISHRNQIAENHREIVALREKQTELIQKKILATENCRDVVHKAIPGIYNALRDALICARRELSFELDEREYADLMSKNLDELVEYLQRFLADLRNSVREEIG